MQHTLQTTVPTAPAQAQTLPINERRLRLPRLPWLVILSVLILIPLTLPVAYLVMRALGAGADGLDYLLKPRTLTIVTNSVLLVVAVCASAAAIGVPFAWLTTRTRLPFRRVWLVLGLLPMVIPSYIGAVTFVEVLGPVGLVQGLLEPFGVTRLPPIYGFFGAWLVITLFTYPYVVLPVRAALLNTDPALEEAARGLGLSRWRVFLRVTLPSLRPALAAGLLMTALYTLSDFGAVMVMRYNAFTRAIYVNYNSSFDRERAAVLALVLIALTLGLLWLERRATRRTRNYRIGTATPRKAQPIALGAWRIPALIFCALLVGVGVVLPFGVLIGWAVNPNVTSDVPLQLDAISANAISASAVTAVVAAAAAIPLALLAVRGSTRVQRLLASASYLGNVLPGVVIGLALVYFAANHAITLYQTFPLLILGYATRYITYSVSSTRSALTQISPALEEAARGLGLRPWQVAARVTAPLARAGILGGGALVFLNVMKELPTTLILAPIGYRTLATRIWTASESGTLALVGLPGLVLMAAAGLSMIVVLWRDDSRQRR
jgi:iron(III) transport system permease protein